MKVAVLPIDAIGHVNPLLAIVEELVRRPEVTEVRGFGPGPLADAFASVGAGYTALPSVPLPRTLGGLGDLAFKSFVHPLAVSDAYQDAVAGFRPDVVLYDVFGIHGMLAARVLGVPSVSLVTFPGYGALGEDFAVQHGSPHPELTRANEEYRARYGVDPLGEGLLPVLFPSRDLSVITAARELSRDPGPDTPRLAEVLAPHLGTCVHIGAVVGSGRYTPGAVLAGPVRTDARVRHDPSGFPFRLLDEARQAGRSVVLFSLGTVLTDFRFRSPVGGAPTGREFLIAMLDRLTRALGDRQDLLVVAAVGSLLAAQDEPGWPANFLVRDFVPQREVLQRYADAFITHHGMNSTTESILAGVPMVSVPGVGDQFANAAMAVEGRAAVAPWDLHDPYGTVTAERFREAVDRVLTDGAHRAACARLRETMLAGGGAPRAAGLVTGLLTRAR
ncbi:Oleandomycin glycosyltransferase [Streptomyces sp. ADI96-15]|uniref:nucleotide disphospho-sugar-binding domain-containing protein n=1 Tax=Streptomyces sp. ADI96-15 TaxID=1522761 RepID=UPI000F559AF5|nr:nucleotide disphospho-sugar-binding domain-containing protein [Streptomyces sp. ADI96-15]RPK69638.1 Oleandomycin glycosyltransferase [Streptomyces sp. ADI96-15]